MNKMKNKQNKKIVYWEGFRKELPWILFWLFLIVISYGYYQDKKICDEVLSDPCKICYNLNQTSLDIDNMINIDKTYPNNPYADIIVNDSLIPPEDKDPNARTVSDYKQ